MPEPVYFQWQNEHLLRSIYPLRERKYYLVVDCPGLSCGQGLFVRPDLVEPISEDAYTSALS